MSDLHRVITILYTNSSDKDDEVTIIERWEGHLTPYAVSSRPRRDIWPFLGGYLSPSSNDNPQTTVYCSWFEEEMFNAELRRNIPADDFADAMVVM